MGFIQVAWQVLPSIIETGGDLLSFWNRANSTLETMQAEGRTQPTEDEWNALHADIELMRSRRVDVE